MSKLKTKRDKILETILLLRGKNTDNGAPVAEERPTAQTLIERTARNFMRLLYAQGRLYHPDESAADCLAHHNLSAETLAEIEDGMEQCRAVLADPCAVALEIMREGVES